MKAIIFDMDGLILDSEVICLECYKTFINSYGYSFTKEDYVNGYPGRTLIGSLEYIKEHYNLDYNIQDAFNAFKDLEYKYSKDGIPLKPYVKELLEYLKDNNYKTIIASSSAKERIISLLEPHDILKYFDDIVCGNEVKQGKPAPDIFLKAIEKLSVNNDEALILEDSEAGIQAGYSANMKVICIPDLKYPSKEYQDKAFKVLPSLKDVLEYLKENNE